MAVDDLRDRIIEELKPDIIDPDSEELAIVSSAVIIVEWVGSDGKPHLAFKRDPETASWKILGMVQVVLNDLEDGLRGD